MIQFWIPPASDPRFSISSSGFAAITLVNTGTEGDGVCEGDGSESDAEERAERVGPIEGEGVGCDGQIIFAMFGPRFVTAAKAVSPTTRINTPTSTSPATRRGLGPFKNAAHLDRPQEGRLGQLLRQAGRRTRL